MQENVGGADLVVRSIAGPALILGALTVLGARRGSMLGLSALLAGCSATESAITRTCPLNALLGRDTRKNRRFWE